MPEIVCVHSDSGGDGLCLMPLPQKNADGSWSMGGQTKSEAAKVELEQANNAVEDAETAQSDAEKALESVEYPELQFIDWYLR